MNLYFKVLQVKTVSLMILPNIWRRNNISSTQFFPGIEEELLFPTHFINSVSLLYQNHINRSTRKLQTNTANLIYLCMCVLSNKTQHQIKRITYHNLVESIPGMHNWINIQKSTNVTKHNNTLKKKIHMLILTGRGKSSWKIQHLFVHNKCSLKTRNKKELPQSDKVNKQKTFRKHPT